MATTVMIYSKLSSTDKLGMSADKSWKLRSRSYTAVTTGNTYQEWTRRKLSEENEIQSELHSKSMKLSKSRGKLSKEKKLYSKSMKLSKSRVGSKSGSSELFFSSQYWSSTPSLSSTWWEDCYYIVLFVQSENMWVLRPTFVHSGQ